MSLMLSNSEQSKLLRWAEAHTGIEDADFRNACEAIGIVDRETGKIRAVMVYQAYLDGVAVIHFASDRSKGWATREMLRGIFAYGFIYKGLHRIIGMTPAENADMVKMVIHLGFRIEGRVRRNVEGTEEDIMSSMFASECAWIKEKD